MITKLKKSDSKMLVISCVVFSGISSHLSDEYQIGTCFMSMSYRRKVSQVQISKINSDQLKFLKKYFSVFFSIFALADDNKKMIFVQVFILKGY